MLLESPPFPLIGVAVQFCVEKNKGKTTMKKTRIVFLSRREAD